jgi:hypothetical protein
MISTMASTVTEVHSLQCVVAHHVHQTYARGALVGMDETWVRGDYYRVGMHLLDVRIL